MDSELVEVSRYVHYDKDMFESETIAVHRKPKGIWRVIPVVLLSLLIALGVVGAGYYYIGYKSLMKQVPNEQEQAKKVEDKTFLDKVKAIYELPTGEEPTIATVVDREKLKDQPFFSKVLNGDKLLIYSSAKRVILYRPDSNKVIDVMPINVGDEEVKK